MPLLPYSVSNVPSEVEASTRYQGLQFSSLYFGQGGSLPRERGDESDARAG